MKILLKFTSIELVMLSNHLILCPDFLDASNNSSDGKESVCNAVDPSSVTRSGKYAEEGTGYPLQYSWASLVAQLVKNPPAMQETPVQFLAQEDLLGKGQATHSSILGLPLWLSW